jgi:putative ABC transport system ATP-binding protein
MEAKHGHKEGDIIAVSHMGRTYVIEDVETHALREATFSIMAGEYVAIMGPSGSGKSTLLHILGLLDRASKGEYRFLGKPVEGYTDTELSQIRNREVGFVFQQFFLLPRMSVLENIMLPLSYSGIPRREWEARARKVIDSVGLSHRAEFSPTRLSGGEKQRVAIARALVVEPKVLFADEPTGNLDSKSGEQVMGIFDRLNTEGKTVILITHDEHIASHARRVIRIKDGAVVEDRALHRS